MYDQGNYDKKERPGCPPGFSLMSARTLDKMYASWCLYELAGAAIHAFGPPWQAPAVSLRRDALLRLYHCSHAPKQTLDLEDLFSMPVLRVSHVPDIRNLVFRWVVSAFSML
jgi:hypothetical protein